MSPRGGLRMIALSGRPGPICPVLTPMGRHPARTPVVAWLTEEIPRKAPLRRSVRLLQRVCGRALPARSAAFEQVLKERRHADEKPAHAHARMDEKTGVPRSGRR